MPDNDYEVGYKKTPKHTRFRKGQSGNPNGRPKKSKNLKTVLKEQMTEVIPVKKNGKQVELTKQEAIVMAMIHKALNGDRTTLFKSLELVLKVIGPEMESEEQSVTLSEDEEAVIKRYNQRLLESHQDPSKKEDK